MKTKNFCFKFKTNHFKRNKTPSLHQGRVSVGRVGFILIILSLSTIYNRLSTIAFAQTFDSESYHIDFGNFNMTGGKKTSTNYKLTDSVGQNAPGQYNNSGYTVKAGFQYLYGKNIPLSFEISNLDLDFGSLVPGVGSTVNNTLTISTPTAHGYDIMVASNHPLTSIGSNTTIPDTKCDSNACSDSVSDLWTSSTTYGFGFNVKGVGNSSTDSYFTNSNYFRHFADASIGGSPKIIMSEAIPVENHSSLVTYKINISAAQAAGTYQNFINFIAVPKY